MGDNPNLYPSSERMYTVLLQLNGLVRTRLRRFLNRQEFVGMRPTEIVGILLDREEVYPENTHSYASKRRRIDRSPPYQVHQIQHQDNSDQQQTHLTLYAYENESGHISTTTNPAVAVGVRNIIPYPHHQDVGEEEVIQEYGQGNFGDEEEILEDEEAIILGNNTYTDGGGGGTMVGQRLEYYSTPEKISDGTTTNRRRPKRTTASSKAQEQRLVINGQRQWTSSLRRHWYSMVVKYQRNGLLHCRICNTCMDVVVRGVGLRAGNAFDHVCKHFEKSLFACRICQQQSTSSSEMRDHIRIVHQADTRTFVDFIELYHVQLEQMISYCYETPIDNVNVATTSSSTNVAIERLGKKKKKRRNKNFTSAGFDQPTAAVPYNISLMNARQFCYQMIIKWQRNNALYCRECGQWLRVGAKNNWLRSDTALQHICGHLGKAIYKCRLCLQSTSTSRQIRQHLQTIHKSGIRDQYIDLTETLQRELKQMAACCFDWSESEDGPPINEGRFLRPRLRNGLEKNEGRRQALLHCRQLIQTCANNSRMQCQMCDTVFVAMTANGYPLTETVYNHSLKHVDPAPYACRVCSKRAHNSANMRTHIWSKHKDLPLTEFNDFTNHLRDEIMSVLNQCFNTNGILENLEDGNVVLEVSDQQQESILDTSCFESNEKEMGRVNNSDIADEHCYIDGEEGTVAK